MREPFRSRGFPDYEMDWYGAPGGEYATGTEGPDRQYPGSDPDLVAKHLFDDRGVDVAILHPMTRGIMPDRHLGTAIAAAHNEMMVTRWLEHSEHGDRFRGTIRRQSRRHRGRTARDRQVLRPSTRRADRRSAAVAGVIRQAAVLAAVGGGRQMRTCRWPCTSRSVLGCQFPPTPNGKTRTYEQYLSLHVAELPVSPDEHDRRRGIREDARR